MSSEHSISQWIASLKVGDSRAVEQLWRRYKDRLTELAKRRLATMPKGAADEEDVAQSVFLSLYRGAAAGRFDDVRNRDELWWLLLAITKQKTVDLARRQAAKKRGGGRVAAEYNHGDASGAEGLFEQLINDEPSPDLLVMLEEQAKRLLGLLRDDRMRQIAISRVEGYTVVEIAAELAVSTRSIERKLQLIRNAWAKEFLRAD